LKRLNLSGTQISDAGLASLGKVASLESLIVQRTRITGRGIEHLLKLRWLRSLDLTDSSVSDADLDRFSELRVKSLMLSKTSVADASVEGLLKMPKLNRLEISGTRITDAGFARLEKARPRIFVIR
jgi:Leucine-rich repeat (LRR) protein